MRQILEAAGEGAAPSLSLQLWCVSGVPAARPETEALPFPRSRGARTREQPQEGVPLEGSSNSTDLGGTHGAMEGKVCRGPFRGSVEGCASEAGAQVRTGAHPRTPGVPLYPVTWESPHTGHFDLHGGQHQLCVRGQSEVAKPKGGPQKASVNRGNPLPQPWKLRPGRSMKACEPHEAIAAALSEGPAAQPRSWVAPSCSKEMILFSQSLWSTELM